MCKWCCFPTGVSLKACSTSDDGRGGGGVKEDPMGLDLDNMAGCEAETWSA